MTAPVNSAAPHYFPIFITAPGETDGLMLGMAVFLMLSVLMVGLLFLRLHTLPERMAHKSHKLQFEVVAVLGLLALFTHEHIFWVAGLLLALIDVPDFGSPLRRMAGSLEKIAGIKPEQDVPMAKPETESAVAPPADAMRPAYDADRDAGSREGSKKAGEQSVRPLEKTGG